MVSPNGMYLICLASKGRKLFLMVWEFHPCVCGSIRAETVVDLSVGDGGDTTWPCDSPGNQFDP